MNTFNKILFSVLRSAEAYRLGRLGSALRYTRRAMRPPFDCVVLTSFRRERSNFTPPPPKENMKWEGQEAKWEGQKAKWEGQKAKWEGKEAKWEGKEAKWEGKEAKWEGQEAKWEGQQRRARQERKPLNRVEKEKRWYHNRILKLTGRGEVEQAMQLLWEMQSKVLYADLVAYNCLIAALCRTGEIKTAFRLFNDLKKRGLCPSHRTYTSLFNGCAVRGNWDIFERIQSEMERRDFVPNTVTCNAILKACAMCGKPAEAFEIYSKMTNWNCHPDMHTYSSLIMCACEDKEDGLAVLQRVWNDLIASGDLPNVYCFNLLLRCLREGGVPGTDSSHLEDNERVFPFVLGRGYTMSLGISDDGVRWLTEETIQQLLLCMEECGTAPDVKTFHFLLRLLLIIPTNEGHFLWKLAAKYGIKADAAFYGELLKISRERDLFESQAILDKVRREGVILRKERSDLVRSEGVVLGKEKTNESFKKFKSEESAIKLLEKLKLEGVSLDVDIFKQLLKRAVKKRNYLHLIQLLKEMKMAAIFPDKDMKKLLTDTYDNKDIVAMNPYLKKQYHGYRGYLELWKRSMWLDESPDDDSHVTFNQSNN